jgi:hypothetical protein
MDSFSAVVALLWLGPATVAFSWWRAWNRLPERVAVHFDAAWRANGWTSRDDALTFSLGLMAGVTLLLTLSVLLVRSRKPGSAWPVLIISAFALSFITWANLSLVSHNLGG